MLLIRTSAQLQLPPVDCKSYFLFYYLITLVRTMILSKSFAIACSLALLKVSAAEETISLSAGFMEATNLAQRGENGMWEGFLFDLADVLVDKAAADGVTLDIAIDTVNGVLSDSFSYNEALVALDPDCSGDLCYDMILADCKWSLHVSCACVCALCANYLFVLHKHTHSHYVRTLTSLPFHFTSS